MHCVDVSFSCNDLWLAFQAYLGGSMNRIQETKIGACVDVTFACNDLGLACRVCLAGSRHQVQEPKLGALQCCGLLTLV